MMGKMWKKHGKEMMILPTERQSQEWNQVGEKSESCEIIPNMGICVCVSGGKGGECESESTYASNIWDVVTRKF